MNNDTTQMVTINNKHYFMTVGRIIDQILAWGMDPTIASHYTNYFGILPQWAPDFVSFYQVSVQGK